MKFENGEIVKTGGLIPNTIFDSDEVAAIRMVVRDELERRDGETLESIEQGIVDGLNPYDRG
jgi:hypothetical protein